MVDSCASAGVINFMDCHSGTAGWAQALGTVAAIIFSTAVAIWVPFLLHERQERIAVQRAILALTYVVEHLGAGWSSFIKIFGTGEFNEASRQLIIGQLELVDRIADATDVTKLGPNALNVLAHARTSGVVLMEATRRAADGDLAPKAMDAFEIAKGDVDGWIKDLGGIQPVKLLGVWIGDRKKFWEE